jgi:hypothetical protein
MVTPDKVNARLLSLASLVVLDWPAAEAPTAKKVYEDIRQTRKEAKVLVVKSGNDPSRDGIVRDAARPAETNMDPHACGVRSEELCGREVQQTMHRVGQALHIALPPAAIRPGAEKKDLFLSKLLSLVGEERLGLLVKKFFPEASRARVYSVEGGWSGARLFRLSIDDGPQLYFLKFSEDEKKHEQDFTSHIEAKKWLKDAAVDLRLVPAQGGSYRLQRQAFPLGKRPLLPLCFLSASTHEHPRQTLHALYRIKPQDFLEKAFGRLLEVLRQNPAPPEKTPHPAPWGANEAAPFFLSEETVRQALAAMDDLKLYGPAFLQCQKNPAEWGQLCLRIIGLFGAKLPAWLSNPLPVALGHTHGDPNPRNCLVHPDDPLDMQWIDCGDYRKDGRLVSDLAIVERDIKLVLLGTEEEADGFFDLDVGRIPEWRHAESDAIEKGITYKPDHAPGSAQNPSPVYRAYRLVGLVRQRAQELDPDGRHYFAALLYWTLDALKYQAVRPTKKLLALYSAGEILRKF